ncbi:hypothetical protein LG634_04950 [Streptomyces bambusae]|uniref:hypothetical protein n=1 Tax=Streptomyces bambusae TaxID=1550616 RepID=UPI001CFC7DDF|nr:hypothetical protein [Streptomyces bambusae]MCB5164184.1 hypothetical protein [Streptomyces bambusae]
MTETAATRITDGLEPKNWLLAVTLLVGWHADRMTGVAWGLVAGVFCAALPALWIGWGRRRGWWGDRHVRRRQDRLLVLPGIMASVAAGIALIVLLDGPFELVALIAAMLVALVVFLGVTTVWKISFHTAVPAGAITVAAVAFGPWALAAVPLLALVGWSRVVLRDHTTAQVWAGALLGAPIAGFVFTGLS